MGNIGVTGTENAHAQHIIRSLNVESRYPDVIGVALVCDRSERNLELTKEGSIDLVVDSLADPLVPSKQASRHAVGSIEAVYGSGRFGRWVGPASTPAPVR